MYRKVSLSKITTRNLCQNDLFDLIVVEPCSKLTMFLTRGETNIYKILTLSYFSIQLNCMSYDM